MDGMLRRDPITGIYEVVPAPGEEETIQMPEPVVESPVITETPKKRGRPPK